MHTNGRKENCPRRRGFLRRPLVIYLGVGILFLYIVYKTFLTDSDNTLLSNEEQSHLTHDDHSAQRGLRNEAIHIEKQTSFEAAEARKEQNDDERNKLVDRNDDDDDDKGDEDDEDDDEDNKEQEEIRKYHQVEQVGNSLEVDNITERNKTYDPSKRMHINETLTGAVNETNGMLKVNMTDRTTDLTKKAEGDQNGDTETIKAKLVEDISVQTQELANLVKDTLITSRMNLTDIYFQNKTKFTGENVTTLIGSFTFKGHNIVNLAKALLGVTGAGLPAELNNTKLDEMYSMEVQDILQIAKDVLSKSKNSVPDLMFENKTKLIEKFAFDAQKLAKFASSSLSNTAGNAPNSGKFALPFEKKSPFTIHNSTMTGEVYKTNTTQTGGNA